MSKQNRESNRAEKAAAIRADQARKERNKRVAIVAGILVVLGAIVAAGAWYSSDDTAPGDNSSVEVAIGDGSVLVGKTTAPVKVVVYEDFLCPYCRELEDSTREFLRENAAKGKVQVEYRPINLLTQTTYSARALNAWAAVLKNASPNAALKLHDLFYENQPYEGSADKTTDADIAKLVTKAGGDNAAVRKAMKTQDTAFFAAASQAMTDQGIQGTPTVFVDGKELTGSSIGDLVSQIENAVDNGS
ncbi:disulfide bond formation protein DsbA [Nocardioides marmoriginsengisoli]|uniref:Disulfide bond formation protein DsbA n=1 Tax=Nocardioides marmoriginsengisoli TaxID=661483 RepID=A0A3N0CJH3_9ACTN|nr:thioredoxin domain-containing protein [Nocardioides marmoriginsengisoli]RNL63166.1 disulfide bond formation protein DsbA [Nocardioides marmoriginsengisoli]